MNDFNSQHEEEERLAPYKGLVEELTAPGTRPPAPPAPETFKSELRAQLLQTHDGKRLSATEMFRLWRFAGTAVAGLALIAAVLLFWTAVSNPDPAVSPNQETVPVSTRTAVAGDEPALAIRMGAVLQLVGYELINTQDGPAVALSWQKLAETEADYATFFHLVDRDGNPIAQLDALQVGTYDPDAPTNSSLTSEWPVGETIRQVYRLNPPDFESARFHHLLMGLYDLRSNERLPITADATHPVSEDGTAVWLADWPFGSGTALAIPPQDSVIAKVDDLDVQIGSQLRLTGFELVQGGAPGTGTITTWDGKEFTYESENNSLELTLEWEVLNSFTHDEYTLFFELINDAGNVVQAYNTYTKLRPEPLTTWAVGDRKTDAHSLPLGDEVLPGQYSLLLSLYDSRTDERLPILAQDAQWVVGDGTAVRLIEWDYDSNQPPAQGTMAVPGSRIFDLQIYETPAGDLASVPLNDKVEYLLDMSARSDVVTVEGQVWIRIGWRELETGNTGSGWIPVEHFNRILEFAGGASDALEILRLTPAPGATISATTRFEIEVAYTLSSQPEATLVVYLWPVEAGAANLGQQSQTVTAGSGTETIAFDFTPLDPAVASDWLLEIKLLPAQASATETALVSLSPHEDINTDAYHYRP